MIAYFVHNVFGYSGASAQAFMLAAHLKRNVIIFNRQDNVRPGLAQQSNNIRVINLYKSKIGQLFQIIHWLIKERFKVFHLHGVFDVALLVGVLFGVQTFVKTTLIGEDDIHSLSKRRGWVARRILLKRIAFNIVQNEHIKKINSQYICENKIAIIPNAVLMPHDEPLVEIDNNRFCFVGMICARKRVIETIKYFHRHLSGLANSTLFIIGPTEASLAAEFDLDYIKKCRELAEELDISDRVIFTGVMDKNQIYKVLASSKALLLFSEAEGMPNVVLEAMANNCVPIVSDLGGVAADFIDHGINGWIIDNSENFDIESINKIKTSKAPYEKAKNRFGIDLVISLLLDLYGIRRGDLHKS